MRVPLRLVVDSTLASSVSSPRTKPARLIWPSRTLSTTNSVLNAFTALVPTPFRPTDFLNARLSYLPPVLILDTQSTTFPKGMPRP